MKINWKLRLQNKVTALALISAVVTFIYQILGILGVAAPISQEQVVQLVGIIVNILVVVGVLVDPTTKGLNDSNNALKYTTPKDDKKEG